MQRNGSYFKIRLSCQADALPLRTTALDSRSFRFLSGQTPFKHEKGFSNVVAAIQLGRWDISKGISQNVYERFLFSRSFDSPASLKAASPADFA